MYFKNGDTNIFNIQMFKTILNIRYLFDYVVEEYTPVTRTVDEENNTDMEYE